jgi:surfeit locus 1 family protein
VASRSYRSILVDRGFVADTVTQRPAVDRAATTPIELVGVLRTPDRATFVTPKNPSGPGRWFSRDVPAMARALGVSRPAPVFLFAETSSNPELKALQPAPLPTDIPNRHLEYALTWFGLAAGLVGVYLAVLLRRRKI